MSDSAHAPNVPALSPHDIATLLTKPDPAARAEIGARVARSFVRAQFSDAEERIALDILRTIAGDAEEMVRAALAQEVRHAAGLPHDLAFAIARDVDRIAVPFLQASPVLTDEDLIAVLREGSPDKHEAIARRSFVSEAVSAAVIATDTPGAVAALAGNNGAKLSETLLGTLIDRYGRTEAVHGALAERVVLPAAIAERLVTLVSDRLRAHILTHHPVSPDVAADLLTAAREQATLGLGAAPDLPGLVTQLYLNGRLTPSLIVRAAAQGDLRFLEEAFARLARVPVERAYVLIHDQGPLGLKALYERTGLPLPLYPVFRSAVDVARDLKLDGRPHDSERFARTVIERVLTRTGTAGEADTEYLLDQLTKLSAATAGSRLRSVAAR